MIHLTLEASLHHSELASRSSGINSLMALIWNSLDADAKKIEISYQIDAFKEISQILVKDDGHGISYQDAKKSFQILGGSSKKYKVISPAGRRMQGHEGKGRLKTLSLGSLVTFKSVYYDEKGNLKSFKILINKSSINKIEISRPRKIKKGTPGVEVIIDNINKDKVAQFQESSFRRNLEEKLALFYYEFPDFEIIYSTEKLNFESAIKNVHHEKFEYRGIYFELELIEWEMNIKEKKLYYCDNSFQPYLSQTLVVRGDINISAYLISDYIDDLHLTNQLEFSEMDEIMINAKVKVKEIIRNYTRERLHLRSADYIKKLKEDGIYPYHEEPLTERETIEQQVFDILALEIRNHLPGFERQKKQYKKFTFSLLKETLEEKKIGLKNIIGKLISLSKEKQEELEEILEKVSLEQSIEAIKEIQERLEILKQLKFILANSEEINNKVTHENLSHIVENESWIFGDTFTYGIKDKALNNLINSQLTLLDYKTEINQPKSEFFDFYQGKQYKSGDGNNLLNLVIKMKPLSSPLEEKEISQIKRFAQSMAADKTFSNETEWVFILLTNDIEENTLIDCRQSDRSFGHIIKSDKINIFVKRWSDLIEESWLKHEFLDNKLSGKSKNDKEGRFDIKTGKLNKAPALAG